MTCSCGEIDLHTIAKRATADGISVEMWSDGAITGRYGYGLPGVPVVRPRTEAAVEAALRAGRAFMDDVSIYSLREIAHLYATCRAQTAPGAARARALRAQRPTLTPIWTITAVDRDGAPTERVWRLPRLLWPELAVWDHVNHGRRGRYEVARAMGRDRGRDTYVTTGFSFRTLAELTQHLYSGDE